MKKIVLIGCGNMGFAIASRIQGENLTIVTTKRTVETIKKHFEFAKVVDSESEVDIAEADVIVAVKPQKLNSVKISGEASNLISIMAGVSLETLKAKFHAKAYARAMPNIAAEFGLSSTAITGDEAARLTAEEMCKKIGTTVWLASEKEIDAATALAGSGPAFLALIAEAIIDGGVNLGLSRSASSKLTKGLFAGFTKILEVEHPAIIKERVMSPAGTTAAGIAFLEEHKARAAFIGALKAAYNRAVELKGK